MSKIEKGNDVITDSMDKIRVDGENVVCCGKLLNLTSHIDGADFYITTYQCECGNCISVETKRDEEDRWY